MAPKRRIRAASLEIRQAAQKLRREPTRAESVLWTALRREQLDGLSFRRQHAVDRFILDFYRPSRRLVLEVDGDVHLDQEGRDLERTAALEARGLRVLRFRNEEVLSDLPSVLKKIRLALSKGGST